eukprot:856102-Rhodomonas_salina.1
MDLARFWGGVPVRSRVSILLAGIEAQRVHCVHGKGSKGLTDIGQKSLRALKEKVFGFMVGYDSGQKRKRGFLSIGCVESFECGSEVCNLQIYRNTFEVENLFRKDWIFNVALSGFFIGGLSTVLDDVEGIDTRTEYEICRLGAGSSGKDFIIRDGPYRVAILGGVYPYLTKAHPMLFRSVPVPLRPKGEECPRCSERCERC